MLFSKLFSQRFNRSVGVGLVSVILCLQARAEQPLYLDASVDLDERIQDLIDRLTLDEKAELMKNESIGVPRLGIDAYDWWNEALHGVARAGEATVFPQATGLAAMWDVETMREVADVISTEARAKHHEFKRHGISDRYTGLTFWSPNINIFRDPRWGRGQETYGEDPYLTGQMGLAFVQGMQGDDPRYLKTAATAKHFAVHSGPEPNRYSFNADPSAADFYETYLPAFEVLIREGKVEAVMTAYNALFNVPTTMSPVLYDILDEWEFDGHVVSDCGAVYCIFEKFGLARDYAEAEALAVQAGLCLRCGDGDANLADAVRRGFLTIDVLDEQLHKLLRTWFRLGLFDPDENVPYANIPIESNDSPVNRQKALEAAEKSLVLLKNDGVLPIDIEQIDTIFVVGPNAHSIPALLGNYNGTPSQPKTILDALRDVLGERVEIVFTQGTDYVGTPTAETSVPRIALSSGDYSTATDGDVSGLIGRYFNNTELSGEPVLSLRNHQVDFQWSGAPAEGISPNGFSALWTGLLNTGIGGEYELIVEANGGVRLGLGSELVFEDWTEGEKRLSKKLTLHDNAVNEIRIEYTHTDPAGDQDPYLRLKWVTPPSDAAFSRSVEFAKQSDLVLFVGGISAQLEGEDMRVDYEGFGGGDRSRIELPDIQQDIVAELAATGTPLVFVNLSGGAMAFESVSENANALIQAWYPGQKGGEALGRLLTGAFSPAGRLPLTFYQSTDDLPPFEDYGMEGRTYRYFGGEPLYAFGHGLGYTIFDYDNLSVTIDEANTCIVKLDICNLGEMDGEEVVQVYLRAPEQSDPREARSLAAFDRVLIGQGETETVTLSVDTKQFLRWDESLGRLNRVQGEWRLEVGSASDDIRLSAPVTIR